MGRLRNDLDVPPPFPADRVELVQSDGASAGGGGNLLLHDTVLLLWSRHLLLDHRQKSLSIPGLVSPVVDCHTAPVFFCLGEPGRCALNFSEDSSRPDFDLAVEVTGEMRARDGGHEQNPWKTAPVLDLDRSDLSFVREHANLLSVTDDIEARAIGVENVDTRVVCAVV